MLPFVRMIQYGNVIPGAAGLKKINTYGLGHMFLTDDGDLYGFGTNTGGRFGTGDTNAVSGSAKLVLSGVLNAWFHTYFTLVLCIDGTWKAVGSLYIFGLSNTYVWTDVTALFNPLVNNIKKIAITPRDAGGEAAVYALTYDGLLYGMGTSTRGQLGSTVSSLGAFKQINTGCNDVVTVSNDTVCVLKTDGTVWYTGGVAFSSADVKTFTNIGDTNIKNIYGDGLNGQLLYVKDDGLYVRGISSSIYGFTTADGKGNNLKVTLPFTFNYTTFRIVTDSEGPAARAWIYDGVNHYGSGQQTSSDGRMGYTVPTSSGSTFTLQTMNLPPTVRMAAATGGGYHTGIIGSDGKFYGSGAFGGFGTFPGSALVNYPGTFPTVLVYTLMDLPIPPR